MFIAWENSRHFALPLLVSPPNDVRKTSLPRSGLCFWLAENLHHPIRSITQIWVVTRYQYGISALVSQTSFRGETSGGVAKCRLFSLARVFIEVSCYSSYYSRLKALPFHPQNWPKSFCKTISTVLMYCQRGVIWMDTPSTDSKVRNTLYSTISSTTGKYCSEAFIWMVTLRDIILRRKI